MIDAMKQALEALDYAADIVYSKKDDDIIGVARKSLRQAIAEAEKDATLQEISDIGQEAHTDHPMRHWDRTCPACVEQALDGLAETSREIDRPVKSYTNGEPQYATETPDDLLRQSEREGWRWASECEAEVVRVTDLNQRLMSGAQELRDATDAAEFDEAWSKLFALFKEAI